MGYFDKFSNKGIPFMDGRTKGDLKDVLGEKLHIDAFGFIQGDNGEYAVISTVEYPDRFFFTNSITAEMLRTVQADGQEALLRDTEIAFEYAKSKKGRDYLTYIFD